MKLSKDLGVSFNGRRVQILKHLVKNPNGKTFEYEIASVRNAVAILPITSDENLVLLENFRYPIGETLIEVCAGLVEPGETDFLEAAKRELKEETGYTAGIWKFKGWYYSSPGWSTEKIAFYQAEDLIAGKQELEEAEHGLKVIEMSLPEALDAIYTNRITDLKTANMIMRYKLQMLHNETYA